MKNSVHQVRVCRNGGSLDRVVGEYDEQAEALRAARGVWDRFSASERVNFFIEIQSYYPDGWVDSGFAVETVHSATPKDIADYIIDVVLENLDQCGLFPSDSDDDGEE